jgi:hypothetical protein
MHQSRRYPWHVNVLFFLAFSLLAACGGGGGGGGSGTIDPPPPPPPPPLPAFTQVSDITGAAALSYPEIAFADNGDGVAAWTADADTHVQLMAATYSAATGVWQPAEALAAVPDGYVAHLRVAANADAVAVVYVEDRNGERALRAHINRGSGFEAAHMLETLADSSQYVNEVAIAGGGDKFAVAWRKVSPADPAAGFSGEELRSSVFDPAINTWTDAQTLYDAARPGPVKLASNGESFLAIWHVSEGSGALLANYYLNGAWQLSNVTIGNSLSGSVSTYIATNGDDYRVAFHQRSNNSEQLYMTRFSATFAKGVNELLPDTGRFIANVELDTNGSDYMLAWRDSDNWTPRYNARRFGATTLNISGEWIFLRSPAQIGMAAYGDDYAIYITQRDPDDFSHVTLSVSTYDSQGWSDLLPVASNDNEIYVMGFADAGNKLVAIWRESPDNIASPWQASFDGTNWSTPESLQDGSRNAYDISLYKEAQGVTAVWARALDDNSRQGIFAAALRDDWEPLADLAEQPVATSVTPALLQSNAIGEALYAWQQRSGQKHTGWAAVRRADGSWSDAVELPYFSTDESASAAQSDSLAIAWSARDNQEYTMRVREFRDGAWQPEVLISGERTSNIFLVDLAAGDNGYGLVYRQRENTNPGAQRSAWTSVQTNGSWSTAELLGDVSVDVNELAIESNGAGYAAVWKGSDGVWASIYADGVWRARQQIDPGFASNLHLASDGSGYLAAWELETETPDGDELATVYTSHAAQADDHVFAAPTQLTDDGVNARINAFTANDNEYLIVYGAHSDPGVTELYGHTGDGTTWSDATLLTSNTEGWLQVAAFLPSDNGFGLLLESTSNDLPEQVSAVVYADGSWSTRTEVVSYDAAQMLENTWFGLPGLLATNGTDYAIAWATNAETPQVQLSTLVNGSLSTRTVTTPAGAADRPLVTWDGTDWLVTWRQDDPADESLVRLPYASTGN